MLIVPYTQIRNMITEMFDFQSQLHAFCPTMDATEPIIRFLHESYYKTFIAGIHTEKTDPFDSNCICTKSPQIYFPIDMYHISIGIPTFDFNKERRIVVPRVIKDRLTMFRCSRMSNTKNMPQHLMEIEQMLNSVYAGGYVFTVLPDKYRPSDMRYNRWVETNSAIVAKIELPMESIVYRMNELEPYMPEDQYGSKIDSGMIDVVNDYHTANRWFLFILFKPFSIVNNLDGLQCPNSSKYPEPLQWASYTYSPVNIKLENLESSSINEAIKRFKGSEWYKMSVFQWNKMLKAWSSSNRIFGKYTTYTKKLKSHDDMFIAEPSQSMEQRIRIVNDMSKLKKEPNFVQLKVTRSGIKIIGHNLISKSYIHELVISKGLDPNSLKPKIEHELKKDLDTVKFSLMENLFAYGLIPCMLQSEYEAYKRRRTWLNRQLTPIERYTAVSSEVKGGSKFSGVIVDEWDIANGDIGLRVTMAEQFELWKKRANKLRLNNGAYLFDFQYDDVIIHAMKDGLVNGSVMGLGKTRELLFACILRGFKKVLIVCPKKLIGTWQDEIEDTILPYAKRVRRHWNGDILSITIPNVIEHAVNHRKDQLTTFNIISYDKLKSIPRDGNFFKCPKCGFIVFSVKVEEMRCPGDPFYYHQDPMQDKSCIGQLRRWKMYNSERDEETGKLKFQKYKVHIPSGKKVHWNENHPTREDYPECECKVVDSRRSNPYKDSLTGEKPRPPLMKKQSQMYAKTKKIKIGVEKKEIDGVEVEVPIIKTVYRKCRGKKFHAKWTHAELARNRYTCIITDEIVAYISNSDSQRSQALYHVNAKTHWVATGTPMRGLPQRILNYVNYTVDRLCFPDYRAHDPSGLTRFLAKYKTDVFVSGTESEDGVLMGGKKKQIHKIKNPELFQSEICPFLLRRTRREPEVAKDIPPIDIYYRDHRLEMDEQHRAFYKQMLQLFAEWWEQMKEEEEGKKVRANLLAKMAYLINASTNPHFMFAKLQDKIKKGTADETLKRWSTIIKPYKGPPTAKMKKTAELLKDSHLKREKTIVFATRTATLEFGHAKISKVLGLQSMVVHGGVSLEIKKGKSRSERHLKVQDFRYKNYDVMWAGLIALAEGMNIPEANHGIIYDVSWEPQDAMQAIGRMIRPQQTRSVFADFLMHEGTIDEYLIAIGYLKKKSHEEGIDGIAFDITSSMIPDFRQYADAIVDGTEEVLKRNMWLQVEQIKKEWEASAVKQIEEEEDEDDFDEDFEEEEENGD